jgi:hypothetical protein
MNSFDFIIDHILIEQWINEEPTELIENLMKVCMRMHGEVIRGKLITGHSIGSTMI